MERLGYHFSLVFFDPSWDLTTETYLHKILLNEIPANTKKIEQLGEELDWNLYPLHDRIKDLERRESKQSKELVRIGALQAEMKRSLEEWRADILKMVTEVVRDLNTPGPEL